MNAINELKNEHMAIKRTLSILDQMVTRLIEAPDLQLLEHLAQLVEFFQIFADKCHHGKEEAFLFPALMKIGVSKEGGPIGVMLAEHAEGREYVGNIKRVIENLKKGEDHALDQVVKNAKIYIALLRRHIEKEDTVLFPLANQNLSSEVQEALYESFEKLEIEKIGAGKHEELHALLDNLQRLYL